MLLLIDAGNTRVKWACIPIDAPLQFPATWEAIGSVSHQEMTQLVQAFSHHHIVRCKISNVAGAELQQSVDKLLLAQYPELKIEKFSAADTAVGVQNLYRDPAKLGSDRFASAIAAHHCFPDHDLVVATCGTATTIDAMTAQGDFLGGMILPGLQLMASALAKNTAQLPQIALHADSLDVFATQTDQAIASGCLHAQIGAMQCAVQRLEHQRGKPVKLIVSGGAAPYLVPQIRKIQQTQKVQQLHWQEVENLVLTGLWIAAKSS
ncbi:type III pantothenate kinase [Undibacterium sp. LX15W]|uniref:Type III pantothenate kinase n=2 Tax=Undibacterium flavidum TaxID=2762297 RepID=A0ABR6Y9B8_9BURK|nr:type III pantothenate kinase [Undibacterium flavidum]